MKFDSILIKNSSVVVTMDDKKNKIPGGEILIQGKQIKAVGKNISKNLNLNKKSCKIIDASDCIVLPGFVNTHHHLYQTFNRVIPSVQNAELFDWLKNLYEIWKKITPEWIYLSCKLGLAELALTGCTTTLDQFYIFPKNQPKNLMDYLIQSANEIGLRFHACRGAMSRGRSKGGLPPDELVQDEDEILSDYERVINKFHNPERFSMCQIVLAPCSPFSVTTELLKETLNLARKKGVFCHTHLAETKDEEKYCLEKYNKRPVQYIESVGWLGEDISFAHCVHLNKEEIELLGKNKVGVAHCPTSNLRLGSGIAPVRELINAGAKVGLAVDGSSSNDSSDMLAEVRQALLVSRYKSGVKSMTAEDVLWLATRGGAEVLGRSDIGSIEPGKSADIAMFNLSQIGYTGGSVYDPIATLVFCGDSHIAQTVIINGKIVVDKGKLTTVDQEKLISESNKYIKKFIRSLN